MKKTLLVDHDRSYLVNTNEVRDVVWCPRGYVIESPWNAEELTTLNLDVQHVQTHIEEVMDEWKLLGPPFYTPHTEKAYMVFYDTEEQTFTDLEDMERADMFEYWDGGQWAEKVMYPDNTVRYDVILKEETERSLDTWDTDTNEFNSGGTGLHEVIYELESIDGQHVQDMYLVEYVSQWIGSVPSGSIMTLEELEDYITKEKGLSWEIVFAS